MVWYTSINKSVEWIIDYDRFELRKNAVGASWNTSWFSQVRQVF